MKLHLINSVLIASSVLIAQPVWADLIPPSPLVKGGKAGGGMDSFVAQQQNSITQVTAVRLNPTPKGLEVILETPDGKSPQIFTSSFRNTFVANITNTQLGVPQSRSFRGVNPFEGIASVSVTQQGANSIRVTVVGTKGLPTLAVGRQYFLFKVVNGLK